MSTTQPSLPNTNFLGFVNLPNQVHRKSVKKGFEITLMVVGESGLGKSTLIKSLFYINASLYRNRTLPNVQETIERTVSISAQQVDVEEKVESLSFLIMEI